MSESILQVAENLVHGDRGAAYGHPLDNHTTTAMMFEAFLCRKYGNANVRHLSAEDVCIFNVVQKIARLANTPEHLDSLVDIAGYCENYSMILERRKETK